MPIRIVTDSACDLPEEMVRENNITVVPLFINIGEKSLLDGVEISREEFYTNLPNYSPLPTTAAPAPGIFQKVYENLASEDAEEIISIHISQRLSSTIESARVGAEMTKSIPVTVIDSQQLSLGAGFVVLAAAKAAAEGKSKEEVLQAIQDQISCTHVFAALETVDFLQRSGRMNFILARLVSMLKIKPLLKMYKGEPTAERIRTEKRSLERLIQLVRDLGALQKLALVHTHAPEKAEKLRIKAADLFPDDSPPLSVDVTPVLGTHLGPGVVGFAVVAQCEKTYSLKEKIQSHLPIQ